jgi:MFS family permease
LRRTRTAATGPRSIVVLALTRPWWLAQSVPQGEKWIDTAVKLGALISSVSGFAAIATLTGGVTTWLRFHGAQLPADQAVAATPVAELVTVGAVTLTVFAVVSLAAVLVAYLLDSQGKPVRSNIVGVGALSVVGVVFAVICSRPVRLPLGVVIVIALLGCALIAAGAFAGWIWPGGSGVLTTLCGGLAAAISGAGLWWLTGESWVAVMTVLTPALAGGVLRVAHNTGSQFRWYGVGVFLAIIVYGAVLDMLRTRAAVKLQPVAVLRTAAAGGGGFAGFYVTGTPDSVLLAYVDRCTRGDDLRLVKTKGAHRGRLVELPRSSVEALSIGARASLDVAQSRAPRMLAELRARTGSEAAVGAAEAENPCAGEGVLDLSLRAADVIDGPYAEQLAMRYRPHLMFDTNEPWRPLQIDALMAERSPDGQPRHRICDANRSNGKLSQGHCEPLVGVEELSDATKPGRIIDFDGLQLGGEDYRSPSLDACPGRRSGILRDCDDGESSAFYYQVTRANDRVYADYWWFLRYNHFAGRGLDDICARRIARKVIGCFDHEGDWEGVTAVTKVGDDQSLEFVDLAAHSGVHRIAASELITKGARPVIFIAQGSHASYRRPCPKRCRQLDRKLGIKLPETNTDGRIPWGRNSDAACGEPVPTCLLPLPSTWRAFKGWWGSPHCLSTRSCRNEFGPKSPAIQRRYRLPWCHSGAGRRLACDGKPPGPAGSPATAVAAG